MMHLAELAGRQRETETHRLALVTLRRMRARGRVELSMYRRWRRTHLAWLRRARAQARDGAAA